jgi:chorismate synthase
MAGSSFGTILKVTTWGESHGKALGAVLDGCPAGLTLCEGDIQTYLDRRKPGQSALTTSRQEGDAVEILSGVFEGRTTGTPISLLIRNTSARSQDYGNLASVYRPGHADMTFDAKYGFRDYRGGGRSSGRETVGRVAGGAIASLLLKEMGIRVFAYTQSIGPVTIKDGSLDFDVARTTLSGMPDRDADRQALSYMDSLRTKGDSAGGCVTCIAEGLPQGLGDPVFDKLDACLAKAVMSIGAVKAVEIGDGFQAAHLTGSQSNDHPDGSTNHAGGVLGGISNGAPLVLRAYIKPTPSISMPQKARNQVGEIVPLEIKGRHDPVIVPRAVVVVEAMTALVLADALLLGMTSRLDGVKSFYQNR